MKTYSIALAAVLAASVSSLTFAQKVAEDLTPVILESDVNAKALVDADSTDVGNKGGMDEPDLNALYPGLDFSGVAPKHVEVIKQALAAEAAAANLRGSLGGSEEDEEDVSGCAFKFCSKRYSYVSNCCQDELEDLSGDDFNDGDFVCIQKWGSAPNSNPSGHWGCGELLTCYAHNGSQQKEKKCKDRGKLWL